jgi:hypothetical protein
MNFPKISYYHRTKQKFLEGYLIANAANPKQKPLKYTRHWDIYINSGLENPGYPKSKI